MPTLTPEQIEEARQMSILMQQEIIDNNQRLNDCPRHYFPTLEATLGHKATCSKCGGVIDVLQVRQYVLGYIAAGGNPKDIYPHW